MKWCFLVDHNPEMMEFSGKLAYQVVKEGDSCLLLFVSKIAEYSQQQYFPSRVKSISKVDWCVENYKKGQADFENLGWKEFFADFERFKLSKIGFDRPYQAIAQLYQFFNSVLQEEKPDFVVYEPPSGTISEITYDICQKYNITYLGLICSKLTGKIDVYDLKRTCSKYEKTFKERNNISESERKSARAFILNFLSHKEIPSYVKPEEISRREFDVWQSYFRKSIKMLPFWLKYILRRKRFKSFDYGGEIQLRRRIGYPLRALRVRLKRLFQGNIYSLPGKKDEFFLFPLQYQPEASTLVAATYFYDLVNTIKSTAFSLPFPYKLYVKEHPKVKSDRPRNFYREIKQIPNVVLISPDDKVESLIKNSRGVITLTSTIGLEAVLAGKPAYVFGDVFYSFHPLCRQLKSFEELRKKLRADLIKKPVLSDLDEINLRFVISYFRNTVNGDMNAIVRRKDDNDYRNIYQEIKKLFCEEKN